MGDVTVELYAVVGTHTKSDIMIFIPEEGLFAIGDMWSDQMLPYLLKKAPWNLGFILENWSRTLESGREIKHVNMAHSERLVIQYVNLHENYIEAIWERMQK